MRSLLVAACALLWSCTPKPIIQPDSGEIEAVDAGSEVDAGMTFSACASYGNPVQVGANPASLPELSGLAASHLHPGVYWSQNDSGNALELIGIREDGTVVAQIPLLGSTNTDVEDIAVGPCEPGSTDSCVYLADIGDNASARASVAIYKMPEPETLTNEPRGVQVLRFTYPDGAHNAESFVVDPKSGKLYVLTKVAGYLGTVFRLDGLAVGTTAVATKLNDVNAPNNADQISTAADAHPLGDRILVRSYSHLWELRAPGATSLEAVWQATPREIPAPAMPQSEAVTYVTSGDGYLVGTEGTGQGLFRVKCQ